MPVAKRPELSPVQEDFGPTPLPTIPNAWKCCNCNLSNFFYDNNQAWYDHNPEYCTSLSCLHERCRTCFDPGPTLWPIQYADGRPIPHLFEELQESFTRQEDEEEEEEETTVGAGDGNPSSESDDSAGKDSGADDTQEDAESIVSDEDHWLEILGRLPLPASIDPQTPPPRPTRPPPLIPILPAAQLSEITPGDAAGLLTSAAISYPCPLRTTRFCAERFESEAEAWRHSAVHTGQERVKCAKRGCGMVFLGKEAMRLHFLGRHV